MPLDDTALLWWYGLSEEKRTDLELYCANAGCTSRRISTYARDKGEGCINRSRQGQTRPRNLSASLPMPVSTRGCGDLMMTSLDALVRAWRERAAEAEENRTDGAYSSPLARSVFNHGVNQTYLQAANELEEALKGQDG